MRTINTDRGEARLTMETLNATRSSELRIASVSHTLVFNEISTAVSSGPAPAVRSVSPLSEP